MKKLSHKLHHQQFRRSQEARENRERCNYKALTLLHFRRGWQNVTEMRSLEAMAGLGTDEKLPPARMPAGVLIDSRVCACKRPAACAWLAQRILKNVIEYYCVYGNSRVSVEYGPTVRVDLCCGRTLYPAIWRHTALIKLITRAGKKHRQTFT